MSTGNRTRIRPWRWSMVGIGFAIGFATLTAQAQPGVSAAAVTDPLTGPGWTGIVTTAKTVDIVGSFGDHSTQTQTVTYAFDGVLTGASDLSLPPRFNQDVNWTAEIHG